MNKYLISSALIFLKMTNIGAVVSPSVIPEPVINAEIDFFSTDAKINLYGELLYWKSSVESLPYAINFKKLKSTVYPSFGIFADDIKYEHVSFGYTSGFRVGGFYTFSYNLIDVGFIWTQFDQKAKASISILDNDRSIAVLWAYSNVLADSASAVQKDRFLNLDFEIGKTWYISKRFCFKTIISPELAWISEKLFIEYATAPHEFLTLWTSKSYVILKNIVSGVGAGVSIKPTYYLGYGFRIYGVGKFALYATTTKMINSDTFTISDNDENVQDTNVKVKRSNYIYNGQPNFILNLGLEWGRNLKAKSLGVTASLGYEFNYWTNLVKILQTSNELTIQPIIINQSSSLNMQGLTARLALYF